MGYPGRGEDTNPIKQPGGDAEKLATPIGLRTVKRHL